MVTMHHRVALGIALLLFGGTVAGQEDSWGSAGDWATITQHTKAFGTSGTDFLYVSSLDFVPDNSDQVPYYAAPQSGFRYNFNAEGYLRAPVHLPSGVLITGLTVVYRDADDRVGYDLENVRLDRVWVRNGDSGREFLSTTFASSGSPGISLDYVAIDPGHTVSYGWNLLATQYVQQYYVIARLPASSNVSLGGVVIHWRRQISPPPGSPTFPDVAPGFWAFQEIEALAASGITTGFPDGTFRPTEPVTRAQMATFLARALGLHWSP